ncbi:hypothetical protein C5167_014186 [Papaver somniferum]|uniref:Uncharacterized protein n=1 Tax=Papaver somniferum TaxID=3469 RepID=A0A4Y7J3F0_PAPSO|nr:hypothetical protein C5167_014186 [Papaver somniferum]
MTLTSAIRKLVWRCKQKRNVKSELIFLSQNSKNSIAKSFQLLGKKQADINMADAKKSSEMFAAKGVKEKSAHGG